MSAWVRMSLSLSQSYHALCQGKSVRMMRVSVCVGSLLCLLIFGRNTLASAPLVVKSSHTVTPYFLVDGDAHSHALPAPYPPASFSTDLGCDEILRPSLRRKSTPNILLVTERAARTPHPRMSLPPTGSSTVEAPFQLKEPQTEAELYEQVHSIEAELRRRRWAAAPEQWAEERIGVKLWTGQARILQSVADHRRTAAMTCHEIGKSFDGGLLAAWWIDIHKPGEAFVLTTAPTNPQVKVILWKEIGRVHQRGNLPGRTTQIEWKMTVGSKEEIVAMGRKPSDYSPTSMQGIHAPYVLVIVDEANGVRGPIWEAIDSLIANDESKICELGNPDDPTGEFYEHCKPGSGYNVIQIGAFDTPNFTGEVLPSIVLKQLIGYTYVEEKRRKWAPRWRWNDTRTRCEPPAGEKPEDTANPLWMSKVMGLFPSKADGGGLIPITWIKAAQIRELQPGSPVELGVDVGGGGDDSSICLRRGNVYRIRRTDNDPDTMSQCGKVIDDMKDTGATAVKVDKLGIGWGLVNRGKELNHPFFGINVGEKAGALVSEEDAEENDEASDERFVNLRAELCWNVRNLFERGEIDIDPDDDDLAAECASVRYTRRSNGKIQILDKRKDKDGKKIASPNRFESLVLAAAPVPVEEDNGEAGLVW